MSNAIKDCEKQLYQKLNRHVKQRNIQLSQFWYSERICIPLQEFTEMITMIGLQLNDTQIQKLNKQQIQLINLQNVIQGVDFWKNNQKSVGEYITKNTPRSSKIKLQQKNSPSVSGKSKISSSSNFYTTKKYLNQHTKRQMEDKIKLSNTLRSVVNQSNYQLSLKIGQANDICSKLKNGLTYMIEVKKNGQTEIIRNQKGKQDKISQKHFQIQYKDLKIILMNKTQQIQGTLEQDLKKVLVEVMCLSNDMKKQIRLLQKKGVSH